MVKKYLLLLLLFVNFVNAQDYFQGQRLYCESENAEAKKLFRTGVETLHMNTMLNKKYLKMTATVFFKAYQADSTFCDAIFFSGYTFRLLGDTKTALGCYYIADSLSKNKSLEFKVNLAAEALRMGNNAAMKLARKKYDEIIQYFPESSEGYYGFAITSPVFGDVEKGLENLDIAITKFNFIRRENNNNETNFLKGILLTLNKRYEEGLEYFEMCSKAYKKNESYNIHYSLCLLKVSEMNNDEKMKEKARKIYNKIDDKEQIPKEVKDLLIF